MAEKTGKKRTFTKSKRNKKSRESRIDRESRIVKNYTDKNTDLIFLFLQQLEEFEDDLFLELEDIRADLTDVRDIVRTIRLDHLKKFETGKKYGRKAPDPEEEEIWDMLKNYYDEPDMMKSFHDAQEEKIKTCRRCEHRKKK